VRPLNTPRLRASLAGTLLIVVLAIATAVPGLARPAAQTAATQAQLDVIEAQTSRLRELERLAPIEREFLTREELRTDLLRQLYDENPPEEVEKFQAVLEAFGYIPPGYDILAIALDVYAEGTLGYYDPEDKKFRLVTDTDRLSPGDVITVSHEMTHALQDQHYDLKSGHDARQNENDQATAYTALVEGDATLEMIQYGQRYLSPAEFREALSSDTGSPAYDAAPLIIQRELIFPYVDGAAFVAELYGLGGWQAVNAAWLDPPSSTEQILHPEKYFVHEEAVQIPLPDLQSAAGPSWRKLDEDTLGELDWNILIEQYVSERVANQATEGWGGDRYQVFKRDTDGAVLLAAHTVWDTEQDAREFYDAYQRVVMGRYGSGLQTIEVASVAPALSSVASPELVWVAQASGDTQVLARSGQDVFIVISGDPAPVAAVTASLWATR